MAVADVQIDLRKIPLRALLAYAVRCARRVEKRYSVDPAQPDAEICREAVDASICVAEEVAQGNDFDPELICRIEEHAVRALHLASEFGTDPNAPFAAQAACATLTATKAALESLAGGDAAEAAEAVVQACMTAAEAAMAVDDRVEAAASLDWEMLYRMHLGRFPEAGEPIDPRESGILGPLFQEWNQKRRKDTSRSRGASSRTEAPPSPARQTATPPNQKSNRPAAASGKTQANTAPGNQARSGKARAWIARLRKRQEWLRAQRATLAAERESLAAEMEAFRREREAFQEDQERLKEESRKALKDVAGLEKELREQWAKLNERSAELDAQEGELQAAREVIERERAQLEADKRESTSSRPEAGELSSQPSAELAELHAELERLKAEQPQLQAERADLDSERNQLAGNERRVAELAAELDRRQLELEQQRQQFQAEREALQEQQRRLEEEVAAVAAERQQLAEKSRELGVPGEQQERLLAEQAALQQSREQLAAEWAQLQTEAERCQAERSQLQSACERFRTEYDAFEAKRAELERREAELLSAMEEWQRQQSPTNGTEPQSALVVSEEEAELRAELSRREQELHQLQVELAQLRSRGGPPAPSLPVAESAPEAEVGPLRLTLQPGTASSTELVALFNELDRLYQYLGGSGVGYEADECRLVPATAGHEEQAATVDVWASPGPDRSRRKSDLVAWDQFRSSMFTVLRFASGRADSSEAPAAPRNHPCRRILADALKLLADAAQKRTEQSGRPADLPIDAVQQQLARIGEVLKRLERQRGLVLELAPAGSGTRRPHAANGRQGSRFRLWGRRS